MTPPASPPPFWRAWTVPKSDASPEENEDAFAAAPTRRVFAVADGATHSGFAGHWARLLVDGYTATDTRGDDWIAVQRRVWAAAVDHLDVPWFVAERRERGAYAAFLGVSLWVDATGAAGGWAAVAVGDACVFHVRGDRVRSAWPLDRSVRFGNVPPLIGSRETGGDPPADVTEGEWRAGDHLLLMTDALACWFLTETEEGRRPWAWLRKVVGSRNPDRRYREVVAALRAAKKLKDDDTTLLAVRV